MRTEKGLGNPAITNAIRAYLQEKGLSQADFAALSGISKQHVNCLYHGKRGSRISADMERRIRKVVGRSYFLLEQSSNADKSITGA